MRPRHDPRQGIDGLFERQTVGDGRPDGDDYMLVIPAKPRKARRVKLAGVVYDNFLAPKSLASMQIARAGKNAGKDPDGMVVAIRDWLFDAFGPDDGAQIMERLVDPADDIDLETITDLIEKTMSVETPDPTG